MVLEREPEPGAVGAGILLQHLGQDVMRELGLFDQLAAASGPVSRVEVVTVGGRKVMDFGYADVPGAVPALGVHRGTLFTLLYDAVRASRATVETGVVVGSVTPGSEGIRVRAADGADVGVFDLVVGADGRSSSVRAAMEVTRRDHPYQYAALWSVVPDPDGLADGVLFQCLSGTRSYLGVLPTGRGRASIFWSVKDRDVAAITARGVDAWREQARPFAGRFGPLLDQVTDLLPAPLPRRRGDLTRPRDRRRSWRCPRRRCGPRDEPAARHRRLSRARRCLDPVPLHRDGTGPRHRPAPHRAEREAHIRWYSWSSRLMMPLFQSDLTPLAWVRDLTAEPVARIPVVRRQFVTTLMGHRLSPWRTWQLPG